MRVHREKSGLWPGERLTLDVNANRDQGRFAVNDSRIKILLGFVFLTLFNATTCVPIDPNAGQTNNDNVADDCVKFNLMNSEILTPSVIKLYFQLTTCDVKPKPLADFDTNNFNIQENGVAVSQNESHKDFAPNPQVFQLATVLLLDLSGSIVGTQEKPGSLPALQQAAKAFLNAIDIDKDHTVAIYTFDGRAEIQKVKGFTEITAEDDEETINNRLSELLNGIDLLSSREDEDNSTNLNGAILQGLQLLDVQHTTQDENATLKGALVVFTDGTDQASRVSDREAIQAVEESNHRVYSIGLAGEVDKVHLARIGKDGSLLAEEVIQLESRFKEMADKIRTFANSFYALTYCSPKRLGEHELTISVKNKKGALPHRFNAAGFEGGCTKADFQNNRISFDGTNNNNTGDLLECLTQADCKTNNTCSIGSCYDGYCSYINVCIGD